MVIVEAKASKPSFKLESTPAAKSIILENILTCQSQFYTSRIQIASFKSFVAVYIWIIAFYEKIIINQRNSVMKNMAILNKYDISKFLKK